MEADPASSQQILAVLETKTDSQKSRKSATLFAVKDDRLLRKASTEEVHQILKALTGVQTYGAGDAQVAQRFLTLFRAKAFFQLFLNENTFLQIFLTKKKAVAKINVPQSVLTATEALLLFHDIGYVNSCLQKQSLHAKLHWETGSWIEAAFQLVKRAWSALLKLTGFEKSQTAYCRYLIYDTRTVLLHTVVSRSDGLLPRFE